MSHAYDKNAFLEELDLFKPKLQKLPRRALNLMSFVKADCQKNKTEANP